MGMRSNDRYRSLAPGSWIGGPVDTIQFNSNTGSVHGKPYVACQILRSPTTCKFCGIGAKG
ncbi:hypothetical protein CSHISOI_02917 [Colletotrichum shisoi]|uniref:Uncharacterized protein n=1 Tax=Colletotrichum shisoi TaxID=2078593 RepID=A0A5Q4C115_9PEZI|nr:hypothetical protein CSHISOI_02917 [Colletotrichum shisoi]